MYYPWNAPTATRQTMEANGDYLAIRMKSDIVTWPKDPSGTWTEEKYCREPGTYFGLILLLSTRNGEPLAFINDGILQHMRVGGGAGLGAKYLAREDAHVVGMIGSGGMARTYLEAIACVREITECRVYSPTAANRNAFAREMSEQLKMKVVAVDSARAAVRGADILASATDSMIPVYEPDWIDGSAHQRQRGGDPDCCFDRSDVFVRQIWRSKCKSARFQSGRADDGCAHWRTVDETKRFPRRNPATAFGDSAATPIMAGRHTLIC